MAKENNIFCDSCGERIFRFIYKINGQNLCNRCVKDKYGYDVDEKEDKDGSDSKS